MVPNMKNKPTNNFPVNQGIQIIDLDVIVKKKEHVECTKQF